MGRKSPRLGAVMASRNLPTPLARDHRTGAGHRFLNPAKTQCLNDAVAYVQGHNMKGLPTPRATDGAKGGPNQRGSRGDLMLPSAIGGTPSSANTGESRGGERGRLAPPFVEWLMGWPIGWTDCDLPATAGFLWWAHMRSALSQLNSASRIHSALTEPQMNLFAEVA